MSIGDRIYIGGSETLQPNQGAAHTNEIPEGSKFIVNVETNATQRTSRASRSFTVINRGRDLETNPVTITLFNSTNDQPDDTDEYVLNLNGLIYDFYATVDGTDIIWQWQSQELREGR